MIGEYCGHAGVGTYHICSCFLDAAADVVGDGAVRDHQSEGGVRGFHGPGGGGRITRSFQSDAEARAEFERILSTVGLNWIADRITLRASAETPNAEAGIGKNGERFIFYNALFMQKVKQKTAEHWSLVSILAHEIGHHLAFHTEIAGRYHEFELEADYFSGFVLKRLGATLDQAQAAMTAISAKEASATHPGLDHRLQAITIGWTDGGTAGAPSGLKDIKQLPAGQTASASPIPPPLAKPIPSSVPTIAAPQEPFPADLPIDPAILRLVETHPFFANAPAISVGSYRVLATNKFVVNGAPTTTTSDENLTVRWLRHGIMQLDLIQQNATRHQGCAPGACETTVRNTSVVAANGMIVLGHRSDGHVGKLVALQNMVGSVFPARVGNRFSYDEVYENTVKKQSDEVTTKNSCEIVKKYEARTFHPNLNGAAYFRVCDTDTTHERDKSRNEKSQSKEVFFDELGVWFAADPVSPKGGGGFTNNTSDFILKSFALAR